MLVGASSQSLGISLPFGVISERKGGGGGGGVPNQSLK